MQKDTLIIHTDGGSRGNPGPAACAFIAQINGIIIKKGSMYLDYSTNNIAEYKGVILALEWVLKNKDRLPNSVNKEILFLLDSELIVKQLTGVYKIKKTELQMLSLRIKKFIFATGRKISFQHIPRSQNKSADLLVNKELDKYI